MYLTAAVVSVLYNMQLRRFAEISAATSYIHTSEVGAINGCASLQEDSGRVDGAKGRAGVERRASREVTSVDARARVEEQEHEVQPVGDTCPVQRCPAEGGVSHVDHVEGALFVGGSRENGRRENMPGTVYKRYGERAVVLFLKRLIFSPFRVRVGRAGAPSPSMRWVNQRK